MIAFLTPYLAWIGAAFFYSILRMWELRWDNSIFAKKPLYSFFGEHCDRRKYKRKSGTAAGVYVTLPWAVVIPVPTGKWQIRRRIQRWYYSWLRIKYVEAFPFSATLLVWTTDVYHASQLLMKLCLVAAMSVSLVDGFVYIALWSIVLELMLSHILYRKNI